MAGLWPDWMDVLVRFAFSGEGKVFLLAVGHEWLLIDNIVIWCW